MAIKYPSCFRQQFVDANGKPIASGKLEFYRAGTSIPLPAYTIDGVSLGDTVTLDIEGSTEFALDDAETYDICLYDKYDHLIDTYNKVTASGEGGGGSGMINPMTDNGDMIVGGTGGAPERITPGNDGDVLKIVDGVPAWSSDETGMTNPMNAKGDIIVGGTGGTPTNISIGEAGQVLTSTGTDASWVDLPGYVKTSSTDTTPDYLENKLEAGSNVSITSDGTRVTISSTGAGEAIERNIQPFDIGMCDGSSSLSGVAVLMFAQYAFTPKSITYWVNGYVPGTRTAKVAVYDSNGRICWTSGEKPLVNKMNTWDLTKDTTYVDKEVFNQNENFYIAICISSGSGNYEYWRKSNNWYGVTKWGCMSLSWPMPDTFNPSSQTKTSDVVWLSLTVTPVNS